MTHERRIVHNTVRIQDDRQTIAAGPIVAAQLRRDYPDEPFALKLDLWIETEVLLPKPLPQQRPGDFTVAHPGGITDIAIVGTNRPVPPDAEHLVSVVDDHGADHGRDPLAWHVYRVAAERWADEIDKRALVAIAAASQARHRRTCGATPSEPPAIFDPDPAEALAWRAVCQEDPDHDASDWNTPHRATGLGRSGRGELTWYDQPVRNAPRDFAEDPDRPWWRFWERP
jgi:hypothetical protein